MKALGHWTQKSVADFVHSISSNFVGQLETKMEDEGISKSKLASRLNRTSGRVSQVFNDPGNLSLKTIVEYARGLDMKVGIVAYDDGDHANDRGPINPQVFVDCWKRSGKPSDLFEAANSFPCTTQLAQFYTLGVFYHVETLSSISTGGNVLGMFGFGRGIHSPQAPFATELIETRDAAQNMPWKLAGGL